MRFSGVNIRFVASAALLASALWLQAAQPLEARAENTCVACHTEMTPELVEAFGQDPHAGEKSCAGCHGGNPAADPEDMDAAHETADFAPPPWTAAKSVERCGGCHVAEKKRFIHGPHKTAATADGPGDAPGCTGCHTPHPVHRVNAKDSPVRVTQVPMTCGRCHADAEMMGRYGIPSKIVNQYRSSVHGRALLDERNAGAPACTGCHGAHGTFNRQAGGFDKACSRCHSFQAQAFARSRHKRAWEVTKAPVCITCHGNHDIRSPGLGLIGTGEGSICGKCHNPGEEPDKMKNLLATLEEEYLRGQEVLILAEKAHRDVESELAVLEQVRDQLHRARRAVHYFNVDRLKGEVDKGLAIGRRLSTSVEELLTESSCITCHQELDEELTGAFQDDIHAIREVSCQGCHGGNPLLKGEEAMSRAEGFIGVPRRPGDVADYCGRCHSDADYMRKFDPGVPTDQAEKFKLSGHGRALGRNPKDGNVANCIECHGVHGIRKVKDPLSPVYDANVPATCDRCHGNPERMNPYGILTDPFEGYRESVHGVALLKEGDLSAPACNDCHGNHGVLPPGLRSISFVCGQCHVQNARLFRESIHRGIWELRDMPPCESCHGNHAIFKPGDEMLSTREGSFCSQCHDPGGPPDQVRGMLDTLETAAGDADQSLRRAESYLVNVDEGYVKLDKARTELTKMRVLVHRFDLDTLRHAEAATMSLIDEVYQEGQAGIQEARYRRRGFWIALLVFILLDILLILKIRDLERRKNSGRE